MWFKALAIVIATALLAKATIALSSPKRFYAARQRQYESSSPSYEVLAPPVVIFIATVLAWYATLLHYRPWGWVVTGFLSLLFGMSLRHLMQWQQHRKVMLKVVTHPHVSWIDWLLLGLGGGFAGLAAFVY